MDLFLICLAYTNILCIYLLPLLLRHEGNTNKNILWKTIPIFDNQLLKTLEKENKIESINISIISRGEICLYYKFIRYYILQSMTKKLKYLTCGIYILYSSAVQSTNGIAKHIKTLYKRIKNDGHASEKLNAFVFIQCLHFKTEYASIILINIL